MALLDVVQWDNKPGEVIFKFEEGAIALGSQLIVKEGQEAIFFNISLLLNLVRFM